MRFFGRVLNPDWTDLALVLGPNTKWVEDDYEDLQRFAPEVLLGYRVRLAVPTSELRGMWVRKLVLLRGLDMGDYRTARAVEDAVHSIVPGGKCEWYRVHRGLDPVVQRVDW